MTLFEIVPMFMESHGYKSEKNMQQMGQYVYSIPCECGRSYIGEIGRPLAMWLATHIEE
jgi:hypothetical protein